jgi:uncharacterized membrane protein
VSDPRPASRSRLDWLDWLRGVAVVVMIEAHTVDAWTQIEDRRSLQFGRALIVGGMGAPLFLFLAGVAAVLAAESRARKSGDPIAAARSVRRRGWEIFGLAFLFRLQSYLLNPGATIDGLLKVDILNVMGPSIVLAAWLWQWGRGRLERMALLSLATIALAMATPLVRTWTPVAALPDPLEAYIRPLPGLTNFAFFPWGAFVPAGAVTGLVVAAGWRAGKLGLSALGLAAAGAVLSAAGYALSFQPMLYPDSRFWTTSPTFFMLRVGILTGSLALAYAWERRPGRHGWSPLVELGKNSLFVYWIHVELVYGVVAAPLRRALPLGQVLVAAAMMCILMLLAIRLKDHVQTRLGSAPRLRGSGREATSTG